MHDSNSHPNSLHSMKCIIVWFLSWVHFASIVASFEVFSPFAPGRGRSRDRQLVEENRAQTHRRARRICPPSSLQSRVSFVEECSYQDQDDLSLIHLSSSRNSNAAFAFPRTTHYRPSHSKLWLSSSPESLSQEPENADAISGESGDDNVGYNDLYEFLTRRTGEQAGETERRRKRDRLKQFIGKGDGGNNSRTEAASNLIQPLRMEDGKVDEALVDQQEQEKEASRTRVRFDSLFANMPSLEEIISREPSEGSSDTASKKKKTRMTDADDFSWFEPERLRIEQEYDRIRQETKERIREQRRELEETKSGLEGEGNEDSDDDGNSIPDNAENIADAIVTQEMNRMINSVQVERAKERLQDYAIQRNTRIQSRDYQGASDDVVDQIFKETAEDWERKEKLKAKEDEYQRYVRMRQQQASMEAAQQQSRIPDESQDMDDWTLDRLEEMLEKSQKEEDYNGSITDILEENIDDLRLQIERQSTKGSIEPQTMKEWQMYRSIATRLSEQQQLENSSDGSSSADAIDDAMSDNNRGNYDIGGDVDEAQVAQQLNSWREYVEKEEGMRKKAGLSSVSKLPFDYLGTKVDQIEAKAAETAASDDEEPKDGTKNMSRRELRREINIQAIQAMEDLIQKSDSRRTEFLKKQLEITKAELESNDYNDIEEYELEEEEVASREPVDLTGVFTQGRDEDDEKEQYGSSLSSEEVEGVNQLLSFSSTGAQYTAPTRYEEPPLQQPQPPDTPFFSDSFSEPIENQAPVPNTPFFQDQSSSIQEEDVIDRENKLGSVDEQKLQAMFRKANARTKSEQDAIRKNWEDFQAFEKGVRDKSGLSTGEGSDDSGSSLTDGVDLKYDVKDVMTGDGDFDAEKILSSIGPRPTRKKKPLKSESTVSSNVDPIEVEDAIYRSVAAAGGGRGKDDDAVKEKDRAAFDDYMAKEKEMKRDLDGLEDEIDKNTSEGAELVDVDINDPEYAEDNLGPRPVVKPKRKEMLDERELSDRGGVRAKDNDDPVEDSGADGLVPGWLRKEREQAVAAATSQGGGIGGAFLGSDINEVFDDDKYDQNLRQLHEYEQRRAGQRGQMGIDISDVLGRRGSDDYVDYTYDNDYFRGRQDGWGDVNFEARKAMLLDYIELDTSELNNLMAHKDSSYSTGASQYLPRINKPFKEFGAIFRLEGVLVDITGIQQKAWNRVAGEFDLKEPLLEDVERASVLKPEAAVKELFFSLMDDYVLVQRVVDVYRRIFKEEFDAWAIEEGIIAKEDDGQESNKSNDAPVKASFALGFEDEIDSTVEQKALPTVLPIDEGRRLRYLKEAWTKTANQFGFQNPSNEQIAESSILTPDIAVRNIFRWSEDQMQINKIVAAYSILQAGGTVPMEEEKPDPLPTPVPENVPIKAEDITEDMILELQYMAWEEVAEQNSLEVPDPEEILAAAVLNNPEVVVVDGFGWTEDPKEAAKLASSYRESLTNFVNNYLHNRSYNPESADRNSVEVEQKPVSNIPVTPTVPTDEEILTSQLEAWKETAKAHDFDVPPIEQIQSMSKLYPKDAVRQIILIDIDINELDPEELIEFELTLEEIIETYTLALEESSKRYLAKYNLSINSQRAEDSHMGASQKQKEVSQDEIYSASFDAWTTVAWKMGFPLPIQQEIQFALTVGPKEAIIGGFCWTESEEEAEDIAQQYLNQIKLKRDAWHEQGYTTTTEIVNSSNEEDDQPLVRAMPDVTDWIKSLQAVEMGCGVVTHLEADQMDILLDFVGLSDLLRVDQRVSNTNGYLRDSQQLLGVSLRIERRPDQCVVFDTSPVASIAAHEHDMRSVALVGPYPRYELLAADTSAASVDELTALNIRRLFAERIYDQPELETQYPLDSTTGRQVKTTTQWAGDE